MEIDITSLLEMDCFPLSHSAAEGGQDAGRNTWHASQSQADETPLLDTPEKIECFRDWLADWGAWDEKERAAMSDRDLNALFLQWVAGDCRELGADSLGEIDWHEAEEMQRQGQVSSNLFRGDDGKIYFTLSH
jgi:hypothetical protein